MSSTPAAARLADHAVAAYLGLALGDALGATVEFMTPREIAVQYGVHQHLVGGGWLRLKPGQITDDTAMSLAMGRAILETGGIDVLAIARAFDDWMRGKPPDIGNTVRRGLMHFRRTGLTETPANDHDAGNGAAMRVLPMALATLGRGEEEVRAACRLQARITHHHPLSDAGTETLALMLQDALGGATREELLTRRVRPLVERHPEFAFQGRARRDNPSGYIVDTFQAVFQALFSCPDFESCLIDVVNRGGDADTTGAIAGMLAGALYGLSSLPPRWLQKLDPVIREQCRHQAVRLATLSPD